MITEKEEVQDKEAYYNEIINNPEETIRVHKLWNTTNVGIGGMPVEARKRRKNHE